MEDFPRLMSHKVIALEGFSVTLSTGIGLKSESLNILEIYACILLNKEAFGQTFKMSFESSFVDLLSLADTAKLNEWQ